MNTYISSSARPVYTRFPMQPRLVIVPCSDAAGSAMQVGLPSVGMPSLRPPGPQLPRATLLPLACMRLKPHPASHGLLRAAHTRLPSALSRDAVSLALLPGSRSPDRTLIFNALLRLFLPVR